MSDIINTFAKKQYNQSKLGCGCNSNKKLGAGGDFFSEILPMDSTGKRYLAVKIEIDTASSVKLGLALFGAILLGNLATGGIKKNKK